MPSFLSSNEPSARETTPFLPSTPKKSSLRQKLCGQCEPDDKDKGSYNPLDKIKTFESEVIK